MQQINTFATFRAVLVGVVVGAIVSFGLLGYMGFSVWVLGASLPLLFVAALRWRFLALGLLLGGLWFAFNAYQQLNLRWPISHDKTQHTLQLVLAELPDYGKDGEPNRFLVKTIGDLSLEGYTLKSGSLIRFSDYQYTPLKVGEIWQAEVVLRSPRSYVNPAGFDYAKWLFAQQIVATGYLVRGGSAKRIHGQRGSLLALRSRVSDRLDAALQTPSPLLKALIMADKRGLSDHHHQLLQRLGLSHLFVISGLHVGMVAMALWWFAAGLKRVAWFPTRTARGLVLQATIPLLGAFVYAGLAGFSLPTLRALVMAAVALLAFALRRNYSVRYAFLLAAVIVILLEPLAIMSVTFWLSFLATASLLWLIVSRNKLRDFVLAQWVIFLVLAVVSGLFQLSTPLIAPLINLVAIPVMTLLLLPLSLLSAIAALLGWSLPINGMALLFEMAWEVLVWVDTVNLPVLTLRPLLWQSLVAAFGLLLAWCAPRLWFAAAACVLLMFIPIAPRLELVRVTVLDVGQGLSILIQTPDSTVLYDTGARYPSGFSMAEAVVEPVLKQRYIQTLDAMIISHSDNDHAGGLPYLNERFSFTQLYAPESAVFNDVSAVACRRGVSVFDGFAQLYFITPPLSDLHSNNNRSCVAVLKVGEWALLLPGDIEVLAELALDPADLNGIEAIVVPHHGSRTSSTRVFLDHMNVKWAFVSAGFNNRFNHPHQTVIERYQLRGAEVFNTASDGAIQIEFDEDALKISRWRDLKFGFWHNE